jgi:FMN-dependent NADH-azoreductase
VKTLLEIKTSLFSNQGQSSQLAERFVQNWRQANPDGKVVVRDLALEPVPHLDAARLGAFLAGPDKRTPERAAVIAYSDRLIQELRDADVVVLGLPMYNFGIPSTLKAYFDHIARAGVTFRYAKNGAVGLLTGKTVYVFAARGGFYYGTPRDTQAWYVRDFLAFLGMTDVEFIYAEGLAVGSMRERSLAKARAQVDRLTPLAALVAAWKRP